MRRLKYFSRKRPVTAQSSLALIAANAVSRRITETCAPKRARNSYIRDHEHPAERMHNAGYELITTAPRPRTAVFRNRGNRLGGTTDGRQPPRDPHRLRRRRNRWRVHQRICLGPVLRARAQSSSMSPPLPTSSGSGRQEGQEPDRTRSIMRRRDAMPPLACFLVHVSCQQAPAATDTFSAVRSQHVHTAAPAQYRFS